MMFGVCGGYAGVMAGMWVCEAASLQLFSFSSASLLKVQLLLNFISLLRMRELMVTILVTIGSGNSRELAN